MRTIRVSHRQLDEVMKSVSDLLQAGEVRSVTTPSDSWDGHRFSGKSVMEMERKTGVQVSVTIEHELSEDLCQLDELKPYLNTLEVGSEITGVEDIVSLPYLAQIKLAGGFEVSLGNIQQGLGLVVINTKKPLFGSKSQTVSFFSLLGATLIGVDDGK